MNKILLAKSDMSWLIFWLLNLYGLLSVVSRLWSVVSLDSKGTPASAGSRSIWIIETKTPGIKSILPVDLHTQKVDPVAVVHDHWNSFYLK